MTDKSLNDKLERLLSLMEAQLELTRQGQREEHLCCACLSGEETIEPSHPEDQRAREDMMGDPPTPSPASHPRQVVSFVGPSKLPVDNYDKYASPTGPRYFRPHVEPYSQPRAEPHGFDQEDDTSTARDPSLLCSKPVATPFPKFNPRDVEIFILEAEAWFKFNQVYEQARMINHMGAQLEGNAREWWTSKLRIDRGQEGRLFNDWHYFTECLMEQFNPRNARMEAYNKLLALWLTSNAPGAATRHVEQFRDLEGQVNLDDNELVIDLFRGKRLKKFELLEEAQQAFHKLIQAFTMAGVLWHFDYHLPTRLETDASDFAIAGVLKQEHEGHWHPVAFYSRKMSSAEKNYENHDKELLTVVACLTQWHHMLAGLPSQLVILTDHEALKYFKSQCCITGQQARWAVLLADFDFMLQY
ncbi:hypothetical protein NDA10_001531 [Ustilago hordei]|nr:hypothetical protein NDA10_001531 [Ustilago hordei]